MKFCDECGAQLEDNAKFCDECGAILETETQAENIKPQETHKQNDKIAIVIGIVCLVIVLFIATVLTIGSTKKKQQSKTSVDTTAEMTSNQAEEVTTEEVTTEEVTTEEITTEEVTTEQTVVEENENTYYNELLGYTMLIPEGFEIVEEFADNDVKDGVMLSDGSAQIEIRGSDYITINTASDVMEWANGNITWSDLGDNYCCYSYDLNGVLGCYGCYFDGNIEVYFNFQYIIDFQKDSYDSVVEQLCKYIMNGNVVK